MCIYLHLKLILCSLTVFTTFIHIFLITACTRHHHIYFTLPQSSYLLFLLFPAKYPFLPLVPSSRCLQIPYDSEEIRRALIAVHNFAVPQIKVLFSFHYLFSSHCVLLLGFLVSVCIVINAPTWHDLLPPLFFFEVVTLSKERLIFRTVGKKCITVLILNHNAEMTEALQSAQIYFPSLLPN